MTMTAEEWNNAAKNSWLANIGRRNFPISNGYSVAPPSYNFYSTQNSPIQFQNAPPINQALNENFQPTQFVESVDRNGQPVRVPAETANATKKWFNNYVDNRVADVAPLIGLTAAGISGTGLARYGMAQPQITGALTSLGATRYGKPLVDGLNRIVYNPLTEKIENGVRRAADWIGIGGV